MAVFCYLERVNMTLAIWLTVVAMFGIMFYGAEQSFKTKGRKVKRYIPVRKYNDKYLEYVRAN